MTETLVIESVALQSKVAVNVIKPSDEDMRSIMIFLHGQIAPEMSGEVFHKLPEELEFEKLCNRFHVMIVMPLMRNRYYLSTEDYDCDQFVARELPEFVRQRYHLLDVADMILAGVSMGGFGATLIAAHTGAFRRIVSISGAYIVNDVEIGNPEVWCGLTPLSQNVKESFLCYFLPLSTLGESTERNPLAALRLFAERSEPVKIYASCGTADWLYKRNIAYLKALDENALAYVFDPIDGGGHDAECFKEGLWNAMTHFT